MPMSMPMEPSGPTCCCCCCCCCCGGLTRRLVCLVWRCPLWSVGAGGL